jgi:hypothetical protein
MRGIQDDVELAEVQGGLFDGVKLEATDQADDDLVRQIEYLSDHPMEIEAPWVKAFAVSVLEQACRSTLVQAEKERYRQKQYALAWHSPKEDDPILLYLRSRECRESGQRTRELRYLRGLLEEHPDFLHARLLLAKCCWALAKTKAEPQERLFARDTAKEFLERYPHFLTDPERKEFKRLVQDLAPPTRRAPPQKRRPKRG